MVKTLTGPELLSLYRKKKLIHRLIRWNPDYVKQRKKDWLGSLTPPKEPLELSKVYTLTNKNGKTMYMLRFLCSDKKCRCHNGSVKHPWKIDEDSFIIPNDDNVSCPVFAKYGAFIIGP